MSRPIQISEHKRMTLTGEAQQIQIRLEYNTKKDPEWKQARGGFNMDINRKEIKQLIKQLKGFLPEE